MTLQYRRSLMAMTLAALFGFTPTLSHAELAYSETRDSAPLPTWRDDGTQWYEVSVVVFKNRERYGADEAWPSSEELELELPQRALSLAPTDSAPAGAVQAFTQRESSDSEFQKVLANLRYSSAYEVLMARTWLQPAYQESAAIPILFQAGEQWGEGTDQDLHYLNGTVTLQVSRFLHMKVNLWLANYELRTMTVEPEIAEAEAVESETAATISGVPTGPTRTPYTPYSTQAELPANSIRREATGNTVNAIEGANDGATASPADFDTMPTVTRYVADSVAVMQESRRMRSGELHYVDHPLYGAVIKITSYTPTAANDTPPAP